MSWDRERTPRGGDSKNNGWISRQIAGFGRYPDKRPSGLQVDERGALKVDSLVDLWGWKQGLTKEDVLRAVSDNLYMDPKKDEKRFEILTDSSGKVSILVHQRRNRGGWASSDKNGHSQATWASNVKQEWASNGNDQWSDRGVATPARASWSEEWSTGAAWEKSSGSKEHVSPKKESTWAGSTDNSWAGQSTDTQWNNWEKWGQNRQNGEHVQRWLGWSLKTGYRQMNMSLKDGEWLLLKPLVNELSTSKPHFNITSVTELATLLEETDQAGRFEINGGYIRKVKRDNRVSRAYSATAAARNRCEGPTHERPERPQTAEGSVYALSDKAREAEHTSRYSSSEGAPTTHAPARVNFSPPRSSSVYDQRTVTPPRDTARSVYKKESPIKADANPDKPLPPPGAGWSKFVDDGHFWWFYEGPLGKWWCQDLDMEVEPYVEEED